MSTIAPPLTLTLPWWVESPDSATIAAELNGRNAPVCQHGLSPCISRCGVRPTNKAKWHYEERLGPGGLRERFAIIDDPGLPWIVIPQEERVDWYEAVNKGKS